MQKLIAIAASAAVYMFAVMGSARLDTLQVSAMQTEETIHVSLTETLVGNTEPEPTADEEPAPVQPDQQEEPLTEQPEEAGEPDWYLEDIPLSRELQAFTHETCDRMGVPYTLALGVMYVESSFRTDALRTGKTADMVGLMQINSRYLPSHYRKYGVDNAYEPEDNITIGVGMLADCIERNGLIYGLMEYNMGIVNMRRLRDSGVTGTGYTDKVLAAKAAYDQALA